MLIRKASWVSKNMAVLCRRKSKHSRARILIGALTTASRSATFGNTTIMSFRMNEVIGEDARDISSRQSLGFDESRNTVQIVTERGHPQTGHHIRLQHALRSMLYEFQLSSCLEYHIPSSLAQVNLSKLLKNHHQVHQASASPTTPHPPKPHSSQTPTSSSPQPQTQPSPNTSYSPCSSR